MIATPIIPGRVYRVAHHDGVLIVIAPDGCTAIAIAAARFLEPIGEELPCAA
jgi:hypothetical protein